MKYVNVTRMLQGVIMALLAVVLLAGSSYAVTYNLAAVEAEWTPPGSLVPVAMWRFLDLAPGTADGYTCPGTPMAWGVGPVIDVPDNEDLTINLRNCLSEEVSLFIPGQIKATAPVPLPADTRRVRSFDSEVAPGAVGTYTWTNPKEGTYLYQSGTFVAKQVPKGLYGGLVVRGGAYPVTTKEALLVYSEIDPVLNNAGVGARVNNYVPQYFLINGETHPNIEKIAVEPGDTLLLRFVNGGLQTYVPTLQDLSMTFIAEDGNLLPHTSQQSGLELTAAKTLDAIVNISSAGKYALYDRSLHLVNGTSTNGGMLTYIQTPNNAPVAVDDNYVVQEGQLFTVAAPGVLGNDTDADGDPLEAFLFGPPPPGTLTFNADGSFEYTAAGTVGAVETFQYRAYDGMDYSASPATVTMTVSNLPPVAKNDTVTTPRNQPVIINILANDNDPDGTLDTASVVLRLGTATVRGATVQNNGGVITYTGEGAGGPDYFYYTVSDNYGAVSNEATVRINRVRAVAQPAPVAVPASIQDSTGTDNGDASPTAPAGRTKSR